MKKKLLYFLLAILFPACLFSQNEKEQAVNDVITGWHKAASMADEELYFSYFTKDAVFIGTDSTENWTRDEFHVWAKPYFERGKAWTLKANSRNIYVSQDGKFAWFDELLYTKSVSWRGSGVLINIDGSWKIQHYVLSYTIPNEKMKEVSTLLSGN